MSKVKGKGRGVGQGGFYSASVNRRRLSIFRYPPHTHTLTRAGPCFMHCHGDALKQTCVLILTRSLLPANRQFVLTHAMGMSNRQSKIENLNEVETTFI